jgi:hypothetical protein
MTENPHLEAVAGGGKRLTACLDFFAREINGTHVSPPRVRREGLADRRSRARLAGRLTFSPIDDVATHTRLDFPATEVLWTHSRQEVLTDEIAGPDECLDFFTSENVRTHSRPEILTEEKAGAPQCPDFFTSENVRANAQNVHFCLPAAAKTHGAKTQFPTGRKFAKKIFIQFPTGRKFSKNLLDISNMVIV